MITKDNQNKSVASHVIKVSDYYTKNCSEQNIVEICDELFHLLEDDIAARKARKRKERRYILSIEFNERAIGEVNGITKLSAEEEYFTKRDVEQRSEVEKIFSELTVFERRRIYMHIVLKMTFKQISECEGVKIPSIQSSYRNGLAKLRKHGYNLQKLSVDGWTMLLK